MDNRKRPLKNRLVLEHKLGQSVNFQNKQLHGKNNERTKKCLTIQQQRLDQQAKRDLFKIQNEGRLLQWAQQKMDDELIHTCSPFSYQSMNNKHFYNLNKKLQNLNQVYEIFKELYGSQRFQLKKQLKQFLFYKEELIQKYQNCQFKLNRILQLHQRLKQKKNQKNHKTLSIQNQKISIKSKQFNEKAFNNTLQCKNQCESHEKRISTRHQSSKVPISLNSEKESIKSPSHPVEQNSQVIENKQLKNLQQGLKQKKLKNLKTEIQSKKSQVQALKQKIKLVKYSKKNLQQQIEIKKKKRQSYLDKIQQLNAKKVQIEDQNQKLNQSLQKSHQKFQVQKLKFKQNLLILYLIKSPLEYLHNQKKRLNNSLQQLRGNIRVYCRIRPICKDQKLMNYEIKSNDLLKIKKSSFNQKSQNMKTDFQFVFDRIFDQSTTQQQVFGQISQLVQSAIDGSNVCIFAYGQTGSGKTFTMQGKKQNKKTIGVIPRSIELIFQQLQKQSQNNTSYSIAVSINQIYNDSLVNLLTKSNLKNGKPTFTPVTSIEQIQNQLNKAVSNRSTAFTLSNADSSRSHLIFVIKIITTKYSKEKEKENSIQSHLILVDLAGSQRVKQSGVSKQRLKEAQHINNSLSQLGQVIRSLKSNKTKTNFRNSKLTFFLQPFLQKGSKAVMFVNISPSASDESQTINSLKFATIARQCRLQESQ